MEERNQRWKCAHPIDKGWAWIILSGSMLAMFLTGGTFKAFGILFVEIREKYHATSFEICIIQATQCLVYGISVTLTLTFGIKFMTSRQCVLISGCLSMLSYVLCSRSESAVFFILSYGVLYGISMAVTMGSILIVLNRYFKKHKAVVNACSQVSSSLGALVLFPVLRYLINEYNFDGGLLLLSGIIAHIAIAASVLRPPELYKEWRKLKEKAAKRRAATKVPLLEDDMEPFRPRSPTSDSTFSPLARKAMLQRMKSRENEVEDSMAKQDQQKESVKKEEVEEKRLSFSTKISDFQEEKSINDLRIKSDDIRYSSNEFTIAVLHDDIIHHKNKNCYTSTQRHTGDMSDISSKQFNDEYGKQCLNSFGWLKVLMEIDYILIYIAFVLGSSGGVLPILFLPDIANDLHIDKNGTLILISVGMTFDIVARVTVILISNQGYVERKTIMIISTSIIGTLHHLLRFFTELWTLVIFAIVYGIFGGILLSLYAPVLLNTLSINNVNSGLSIVHISQGFIWAGSCVIVGVLRDMTGSYAASFHFFGSVSLLSALIISITKLMDKRKSRCETQTTECSI